MASTPDRHFPHPVDLPHPVNFMGEAAVLADLRRLAEARDRTPELRQGLRGRAGRKRRRKGRT